MNNEYEEFLESLQVKKYKPIMTHLPSEVNYASIFYDGYLSREELQERQWAGRYWCISDSANTVGGRFVLDILLDNETVLVINYTANGDIEYNTYNKDDIKYALPNSLIGMYYN